ncbi:lysozyme family protein [Enterococcus faecalis]
MNKMKKIIVKIIGIFFIAILIFVGFLGFQVHQNVQRVKAYEKIVDAEVAKNQIPQYKNLVLAIIYTESKGKSVDLMQSSESAYGSQAVINTQEESISQGVKFLAEALQKAQAANCDEWTGVQAYNFGLDYIEFVKERGGENTVELAEEYSREVLSPLLGNEEKTKYRYYRLQSFFYNGGYLYQNGGNMFYADLVRMNQTLIRWFS